jgi:hypothetical protein
VTRRVALRLALLVVAAAALLVGLTAYFSSEKVPPCLVSGAPKWRPPTDQATHRFLLVIPDRALCFYSIDDEHKLVGAVKLRELEGIEAVQRRPGGKVAVRYEGARTALVDVATGAVRRGGRPVSAPSDEVIVADGHAAVVYSTRRGVFGFSVFDPARFRIRRVTFPGFAWNPRFGPNPPDHGLALFPNRRELWVLDAPNSAAHVYDVSRVPREAPRHLEDVRFSKPLSGDENPCAHPRCSRLGSLARSSDGRFVYVGDAGDVIDVAKREVLLNLEALHQSRLALEVDWVAGKPVFPS